MKNHPAGLENIKNSRIAVTASDFGQTDTKKSCVPHVGWRGTHDYLLRGSAGTAPVAVAPPSGSTDTTVFHTGYRYASL